jgi:hypothetical protein
MEIFISTLLSISEKRILKFRNPSLGKSIYIFLQTKNITVKVRHIKNHYEVFIPEEFKESKII